MALAYVMRAKHDTKPSVYHGNSTNKLQYVCDFQRLKKGDFWASCTFANGPPDCTHHFDPSCLHLGSRLRYPVAIFLLLVPSVLRSVYNFLTCS